MEASSPALGDIEVVEMALVIASLTILPNVEKEVQVAELPVLALLVKLAIIEVANEEGLDMADLSTIQAMVGVLSAIVELPVGEAIGEVAD